MLFYFYVNYLQGKPDGSTGVVGSGRGSDKVDQVPWDPEPPAHAVFLGPFLEPLNVSIRVPPGKR